MEAARGARPVFCYAYRPLLRAAGTDDGGFTMNLMENGLVVFDVFTSHRQIISEMSFVIPQELVQRYQLEVRRAGSWLRDFPQHMADGPQPQYASMVGLDGYPYMFRMDDLPTLINCSFRTARGHNARKMYNLLEDMAGMLAECGVSLQLDSFGWDASRIRPLEEQQEPQYRMFG